MSSSIFDIPTEVPVCGRDIGTEKDEGHNAAFIVCACYLLGAVLMVAARICLLHKKEEVHFALSTSAPNKAAREHARFSPDQDPKPPTR